MLANVIINIDWNWRMLKLHRDTIEVSLRNSN